MAGAIGLALGAAGSALVTWRVTYARAQLRLVHQLGEQQDRIAHRVSHDVRSPLAALATLLDDNASLDPPREELLRTCIARIQGICNALTGRRDALAAEAGPVRVDAGEVLQGLLADPTRISPGRVVAPAATETYGLLVRGKPGKLTAVLGDLIQHATGSTAEKVRITMGRARHRVEVRLAGGAPPPEALQRRVRPELERWDGVVEATADGCVVSLRATEPPAWHVPELALCTGAPVAILDDDPSIHAMWRQRIGQHVQLYHFETPDALVQGRPALPPHTMFLVDLELGEGQPSGLDVILSLDLVPQSILVSSRAGEAALSARAASLRMLPKRHAAHVPVRLIPPIQADVILLDDDSLVRDTWHAIASQGGKSLHTFASSSSLYEALPAIAPQTPIYVDYSLQNGENGLDISRRLWDLGFRDLYITTGYEANTIPRSHWIQQVVDKAPPRHLY